MNRLFVIAGVTLTLVVISIDFVRMENPEYSFDNWPEAVASGQTGLGKWIPADIPPSAVSIRATYSVDSQHTLVAFSIPTDAELRVPVRCKPVGIADIQFTEHATPWWPKAFIRGERSMQDVSFFSCGLNEYYALTGMHGYYWRL